MTPERKAWWDSLPKEEKRIRQIYRYTKKEILNFTDHDKKYVIKALRKQIAMDVIALHNSAYEYYTCPYCGQNVKEGDVMRDEDNYCASCGQKLRWEE